MFNIEWNGRDSLFEETEKNLKKIEGIEEFYKLTKELYGNDFLCWGDDFIDELAYYPEKGKLTVRICSGGRDIIHKGKKVKYAFWMIDFYEVEIQYFDSAPEHWIDETYIQQNDDGKYSITFGAGELDFRYSYAKVNRSWVEYE